MTLVVAPKFSRQEMLDRARLLLDFTSVVVVGGSDNPTRIGGRPLALLKKYGFTGLVYSVNPKYSQTQGFECFPSIDRIPGGIEMAILAIEAVRVPEALIELGRKGVKAATILSSGFSEAGPEGAVLQSEIARVSAEYGIAVNGPNCVGVVSFANRKPATFGSALGTMEQGEPGRVALVSQSGAFALNIWVDATLGGARFSHLISTGNEAALDFGDYLELMADDPHTDMVIGYVEGLNDAASFSRSAEALRRAGKPLVLIKVGRSDKAVVAVSSHTGKMAGNHDAYRAAFDKHGVISVETVEELIDHAIALPRTEIRAPLAIITTSGGAGIYLADHSEACGIPLADLDIASERELEGLLPSFASCKNPVDATAQVVNNPGDLEAVLRVVANDENVGSVLFALAGMAEVENATKIVDIVNRVAAETGKAIPMGWLGVPETIRVIGRQSGLSVFADPARLIKVLGNREQWKSQSLHRGNPHPEFPAAGKPEPGVIERGDLTGESEGTAILDEWEAMRLLDHYGVRTPARWRIEGTSPLAEQSSGFTFPCVLKQLSPVLAHKNAAGGVVSGIGDIEELEFHWRRMQDSGATGAIVAEQVASRGPELIIGVIDDPTFGQRVVIGAGGVAANAYGDFQTLVPPLSLDYVQSSIERLRISPELDLPGIPMAQVAAWVYEAASHLSTALRNEREVLLEIECNPFFITETGLVAVDALGMGRNS